MKIIFFWSQGKSNLPKWAKRNLNLWKSLNDNCEIQLLDSSALNKIYNKISFITDYPIQTQADILRIYLLTKSRAVWADLTVIPSISIKKFSRNLENKEIFLYSKPTSDRLFSNWFIFSNNVDVIYAVYEYVLDYHSSKRNFIEGSNNFIFDNIFESSEYLLRNKKQFPYFWFHYLLNHIFLYDEDLNQTFSDIDNISGIPPHALQMYLKSCSISSLSNLKLKKLYEENAMNKLDWRIGEKKLNILFDAISSNDV